MRGHLGIQWIFFFKDSCLLPSSWWAIYKYTCPHHVECSAVLDAQMAWYLWLILSIHLISSQVTWFLFPWIKKVLKVKHFADVEEVKQKMQKHWKESKLFSSKTVLSSGKKSQYMYCIKWKVLWKWLKFKYVRIIHFFFTIHCFCFVLFCFVGGPPHQGALFPGTCSKQLWWILLKAFPGWVTQSPPIFWRIYSYNNHLIVCATDYIVNNSKVYILFFYFIFSLKLLQ